MKKLLGILLLLSVFSVYAANNNILCSIEYFYSDDGVLIGKAINGNRINYEYDLRGQLLSVKDTNGKVLESYTYDKVGNILSKTVNGKTTTYTYDKANQLISSTTDGKTTNYKYDAAGRMIQAGSKTYRYKYLDKVAEVRENGKVIAEFEYTVDGQVSTATYGDKTEEFMWDGLALIKRNDTSYINEPYITGGNPIIADNDVMFNDMLGNTVAINGKSVDMTAFGETENTNAMFTGKPHVAELGYAFLFRNYNSSLGKWSTSDPLGYPDGWNNLAYVNNKINRRVDMLGLSELDVADYRRFIESQLAQGTRNIDTLFKNTLQHYLNHDPEDDLIWDAEDDMEEIIEAFYDIFSDVQSPYHHAHGIDAGIHSGDGSALTHFFAGAAYEGAFELGDTAQDIFEIIGGQGGDWLQDTAYAYAGADFSDYFDTWTESTCRDRIKKFISGEKTLTGLLGPTIPANTEQGVRDFRARFRRNLAE